MAPFQAIPDELLTIIIEQVPSGDIVRSVQIVSWRLHRLCNDQRMWHARCRTDYRFWRCKKDQRCLGQPYHTYAGANGPNWKAKWLQRRRQDAHIARHFERVVASRTNRIFHMQNVCEAKEEAKDFLLAQMGDNAFSGGDLHEGGGGGDGSDILARRYYADQILSSINRYLAIREWVHVHHDLTSPENIDRATAAFDMFVLHDAPDDMDATERALDQLAAAFVEAHTATDFREVQAAGRDPQTQLGVSDPLHHLTIRARALALVRWLRAHNLVGLAPPIENFRNLRNCLLGHALTDPEHPSLPIVSCIIFVSVARRIGLNAHCCAIPGHMHSTVLAAPGETLDCVPKQKKPATAATASTAETRLATPLQAQQGGGGRREGGLGGFFALPQIPNIGGSLLGGNGESEMSMLDKAKRGLCMFLDPHSNDDEVPANVLYEQLTHLTWDPLENRDSYMRPTSTAMIVLRVAHNISSAVEETRRMENLYMFGHDPDHDRTTVVRAVTENKRLRRGDPDTNLKNLKYATLWVEVLTHPLGLTVGDERLKMLLSHFTTYHGEDAWIVQQLLQPLCDQHPGMNHAGLAEQAGWGQAGWEHAGWGPVAAVRPPMRRSLGCPRETVNLVFNVDRRAAEVSRRYTQEINDRVRFRVGQVVRHTRFRYVAVISGWKLGHVPSMSSAWGSRDDDDENGEDMATSAAARTSLTEDRRRRRGGAFYSLQRIESLLGQSVVSQENLELITDPADIPPRLFFLAGSCCKRFDRATCSFVSNVKECFPDD